METAECVFSNDDMPEITRLIKEADVIILAAPVYWGNVSKEEFLQVGFEKIYKEIMSEQ